MATAMDVFPPRNLPVPAVPWGRRVEDVLRENFKANQQVGQKVDNGFRATAGQLAVVAEQLNELFQRSSYSSTIPNLSVTGNATIEPYPRNSVNFTVPGTNVPRSARIDFTGLVSESNTAGGLLWLQAFSGPTLLWRNSGSISANYNSAPTDWGSAGGTYLNVSFQLIIPAGTTFPIRLEGVRTGFSATTSTLSLTQGVATVTYGAPA